jgi:hypothetical protein
MDRNRPAQTRPHLLRYDRLGVEGVLKASEGRLLVGRKVIGFVIHTDNDNEFARDCHTIKDSNLVPWAVVPINAWSDSSKRSDITWEADFRRRSFRQRGGDRHRAMRSVNSRLRDFRPGARL